MCLWVVSFATTKQSGEINKTKCKEEEEEEKNWIELNWIRVVGLYLGALLSRFRRSRTKYKRVKYTMTSMCWLLLQLSRNMNIYTVARQRRKKKKERSESVRHTAIAAKETQFMRKYNSSDEAVCSEFHMKIFFFFLSTSILLLRSLLLFSLIRCFWLAPSCVHSIIAILWINFNAINNMALYIVYVYRDQLSYVQHQRCSQLTVTEIRAARIERNGTKKTKTIIIIEMWVIFHYICIVSIHKIHRLTYGSEWEKKGWAKLSLAFRSQKLIHFEIDIPN